MTKCFTVLSGIFLLFFLTVVTCFGTPYSIEVDVSSFAGSEFELELDLYDNSGIVGDSWAFIDNIFVKGPSGVTGLVDFESKTLEGFDDSLNPNSVEVVSGCWGSGKYMMRIDEDPNFTPTITYKDFLPSDATTLHMEFEFISDGTTGFWGPDALVASLLDPSTLDPLIPGLTTRGDFLKVTASGNIISSEVTGIASIPDADTLILLISSGLIVLLFNKGRKKILGTF